MKITASVRNSAGNHVAEVETSGNRKRVAIPAKTTGQGSAINGGELLFLALATCFCNDIYREAAKRGIAIASVEVDVEGEFGAEGEPSGRISYSANVTGSASEDELSDLVRSTDRVAEIQNTVRRGTAVQLAGVSVKQTWGQ